MTFTCTSEKKSFKNEMIARLILLLILGAGVWVRNMYLKKKVQKKAQEILDAGVSRDDVYKLLREQYGEDEAVYVMRNLFPYTGVEVIDEDKNKSHFHKWLEDPREVSAMHSFVFKGGRGLQVAQKARRRFRM